MPSSKSKLQRYFAVNLIGAIVGLLLAIPITESAIATVAFVAIAVTLTFWIQVACDIFVKLEALSKRYQSNTIEFIVSEMRSHVDDELATICRHHVDHLVDSTKALLNSKELRLPAGDMFTLFYVNALAKYPKGLFIASAHYGKNYVWRSHLEPHTMEYAIKQRFQKGGRMKRIFIVFERDLKDPDFALRRNEVIRLQEEIGVEVYEVHASKLKSHSTEPRFVMTTPRKTFSWEVFVDPDGNVDKVVATTQPKRFEETAIYLERVLELSIPVQSNSQQ